MRNGLLRAVKTGLKLWLCPAFAMMLVAVVESCNVDDVIENERKAVIEFDHPDGIYETRVGEPVELTPKVEHGGARPEMEWSIDGEKVGTDQSYVFVSDKAGDYYLLFSVTNGGGTSREEVMVRVLEGTPPGISLAVGSDGVTMKCGSRHVFAPEFSHDSGSDFSVEWMVDGDKRGSGRTFEFEGTTEGVYIIKVRASNSDGYSETEVRVNVVAELPIKIEWIRNSRWYGDETRYTFAERGIVLWPEVTGDVSGKLQWSVDGVTMAHEGDYFVFTPQSPGVYQVTASLGGVESTVKVVCVEGDESSHRRAGTGGAVTGRVWEYVPAPGQFIGDESNVGGMPQLPQTHEEACQWAENRLDAGKFVSLGAWGGFLTVGFDYSIGREASGGYALEIEGNAIATMNEPGVVWVSQDVNGNGLPDDEWYELRGSDYGTEREQLRYKVTYYRPGGSGMGVMWTDNAGTSGRVDRVDAHRQASYYPEWGDEGGMMCFFGSRITSRTIFDAETDYWNNPAIGWGYADNLGRDGVAGRIGSVGLKIANAVRGDGEPMILEYVDFVRVQTGQMGNCGRLGELSTEVCGVRAAGS